MPSLYKLYLLLLSLAASLEAFKGVKCYGLLDVVFLVDESGSVCDIKPGEEVDGCDNWKHVLKFISEMVRQYQIDEYGTNVALVKFNTFVSIRWNFDGFQEKRALIRHILKLPYGNGGTNTGLAINVVRKMLLNSDADREEAPNIVIIITDGDAEDMSLVEAEIKTLEQNDVKVYAIGIGNVSADMLARTSSQPQKEGQTWFRSPDFAQLKNILKSVQKGINCDGSWWSHFYQSQKYLLWILVFLSVAIFLTAIFLVLNVVLLSPNPETLTIATTA